MDGEILYALQGFIELNCPLLHQLFKLGSVLFQFQLLTLAQGNVPRYCDKKHFAVYVAGCKRSLDVDNFLCTGPQESRYRHRPVFSQRLDSSSAIFLDDPQIDVRRCTADHFVALPSDYFFKTRIDINKNAGFKI